MDRLGQMEEYRKNCGLLAYCLTLQEGKVPLAKEGTFARLYFFYLACVTTSTSAGSPRFTAAAARRRAGPRSFGSVMGPSACRPMPWATLAKSMLGSVRVDPIVPRSTPRLRWLHMRCTCMIS